MVAGVKEKEPIKINPYRDNWRGKLSRWVDNTIEDLFPKWGSGRKAYRYRAELMKVRAEKLGVSWTRPNANRDSKWFETGYSIDAVLDLDIEELHNRCAECYRTNNVAHAAVEGRIVNEVGAGIKAQSRVTESKRVSKEQSERINTALDRLFAAWSKHGVDEKRSMTMSEFERLAGRSLAIFGEALVVVNEVPSKSGITLACEVISPERLSTPPWKQNDDNCRLGVQHTDSGSIAGYWIRTTHPGETGKTYEYDWDFFPRYDERGMPVVLHVFEKQYAGQSRGIPWLAAALDRIKDLDDWFEAELIAKQVEACFGLIFTGGETSAAPADIASANSSETDDYGRQLEELEPGMIHYANDGEQVTTVDPQRPGATFAPFVEQTLRSIAAAINLPYEILAKNFFRTTFSSGQLAMLDGRHGFRTRRQLLIDGLLVPIWERFVDDAVFYNEADGTIEVGQFVADREAFTQCVWVPPGWGFVNPKDEVKAASEALKNDMTNLATLFSERGEDAEVQLKQRQQEKLQAIRDEIEQRLLRWELEEQYGLPHMDAPASEEDDSNDDEGSSSSEESETADAEEAAAAAS